MFTKIYLNLQRKRQNNKRRKYGIEQNEDGPEEDRWDEFGCIVESAWQSSCVRL